MCYPHALALHRSRRDFSSRDRKRIPIDPCAGDGVPEGGAGSQGDAEPRGAQRPRVELSVEPGVGRRRSAGDARFL